MIAVELGNDFHVGAEGPDVALFELEVGMRERLHEARDLDADIALGRVEPPLGDGAVDDAPRGRCARPERLGDLLVGKAGKEQVENRIGR
jgi:hypothetical protein